MYTMDYSADYGLDEFLEKDASNDKRACRICGESRNEGITIKY